MPSYLPGKARAQPAAQKKARQVYNSSDDGTESDSTSTSDSEVEFTRPAPIGTRKPGHRLSRALPESAAPTTNKPPIRQTNVGGMASTAPVSSDKRRSQVGASPGGRQRDSTQSPLKLRSEWRTSAAARFANDLDSLSFGSSFDNLSLGAPTSIAEEPVAVRAAAKPAPRAPVGAPKPSSSIPKQSSLESSGLTASSTAAPAQPTSVSSDLDVVVALRSAQAKKKYTEGYIYKRNELSDTGHPLISGDTSELHGDRNGDWTKWWAELRGTTLRLWRVPDHITQLTYTPAPTVEKTLRLELDPMASTIATIKSGNADVIAIDVSQSVVEIFPPNIYKTENTANPPPVPYTNFFGMSTAGSNLYYFAALSTIQSNTWVAAIRLAIFESTKINEFLALKVLKRPTFASAWKDLGVTPFTNISAQKGEIKYEGSLEVRSTYATKSKPYYVVIKRSGSGGLKLGKKLFGNKKRDSTIPGETEAKESKKVTFQFFESKAEAKKGRPAFVLDSVTSASLAVDDLSSVENGTAMNIRLEARIALPPAEKDSSSKGASLQTLEQPAGTLANVGSKGYIHCAADPLGAFLRQADPRPAPPFINLRSANAIETASWLIAISTAFNLDVDVAAREEEISSLNLAAPTTEKSKKFRRTSNISDSGSEQSYSAADDALYLTTEDISGLNMSNESHSAVTLRYGQVYADKKRVKKDGFAEDWADAVWEGEKGRREYERREVEHKVAELVLWLEEMTAKQKQEVAAEAEIKAAAQRERELAAEKVKKAEMELAAAAAAEAIAAKALEEPAGEEVTQSQEVSESPTSSGDGGSEAIVSGEPYVETVEPSEDKGGIVSATDVVLNGIVAEEFEEPAMAASNEPLEPSGSVVAGSEAIPNADENTAVPAESAPLQDAKEEISEENPTAETVRALETAVTPEASTPAAPSQMMMVPVPILQANGQWAWQYQCVDPSKMPPGWNPQSAFLPRNDFPEVDSDSEDGSTPTESGSESDEEGSGSGSGTASSKEPRPDAPKNTGSFPPMPPGMMPMMFPPGMMQGDGTENMGMPGMMPMMMPGTTPGFPPMFMAPNGVMIGPNGLPIPPPGMMDGSAPGDANMDAGAMGEGEESVLTPQSLLANLEGRAKSSRRDGPLVQLEREVVEHEEQKLVQPAYVPQYSQHAGPLLGHVPDNVPNRRPKMVGGLLAEVERREKEKEMLKRMGVWRPTTAPTGGYIPTYLRGGMNGGAGNRNSMAGFGPMGMPGMPPMMPPMMPPHIGPTGLMSPWGYPISEFGDPHEDPSMAAQREELRREWLEKERAKERQRMSERTVEYYGQPNYYPPTVAASGHPGMRPPSAHPSYYPPYPGAGHPEMMHYPYGAGPHPGGPQAPMWRRSNSYSGSDDSDSDVAAKKRDTGAKRGQKNKNDSSSEDTSSSCATDSEDEQGKDEKSGTEDDEEDAGFDDDSDVDPRASAVKLVKKKPAGSGTDSESDAQSSDDEQMTKAALKKRQHLKAKKAESSGTDSDDSKSSNSDSEDDDSEDSEDHAPLVKSARPGAAGPKQFPMHNPGPYGAPHGFGPYGARPPQGPYGYQPYLQNGPYGSPYGPPSAGYGGYQPQGPYHPGYSPYGPPPPQAPAARSGPVHAKQAKAATKKRSPLRKRRDANTETEDSDSDVSSGKRQVNARVAKKEDNETQTGSESESESEVEVKPKKASKRAEKLQQKSVQKVRHEKVKTKSKKGKENKI
ncbi:uncharacterized protein EV422DRAFT_524844 [Fimicolochytrium jonesii]|uniref:uncharacterized protein n=1 Tax=Fimicolochytrium jonesii TaxID=1396493 RepID=UPI0022FE7BCB|nr:uncharacterized protein EV422DRAFT_524844 [Fimicolochytrium jonesii]KAI8822645.1 hypothetical protein EV422DRAFT_524844 [Fimicolochytrium jonesii]